MTRHLAIILSLAFIAACQTDPIKDSRIEHPHPQHGLTQGPDGWYLTRQDGPWGTGARQEIRRLPSGKGGLLSPPWSAPAFSDSDFYYSAETGQGCFVATRPLPDAPSRKDANIWCATWKDGVWTNPAPLPSPVNSETREWSPVITKDGALYFASDRDGGLGLGDIYKAKHNGEDWHVEPLSAAINSQGGEWNLDVSPDGLCLVFEASHRATNRTVPGDLYLSTWSDGQWSPAQPLTHLNTDGSDLMPRFISNRRFIFSSVVEGDAMFRIAKIDSARCPQK